MLPSLRHLRASSRLRNLILAGCYLAAASVAIGSEGDAPGVCLVLSGGGARGGAHVGVIQVLEELRIPVDCVVGTSIGAIVGGLYATGYSPDEIEETFRAANWSDLFSDAPPRADIPFRRKEDDREVLFRFELGLGRHGISFPSGIVAGQKISFLLRSLTLNAVEEGDFDALPIPFRAVASDLNSGEPVVLARGDLAEAIQASMAIPGVLAPVEIDGRILVDGGVVANLPVDVAQGMGARRIIAVDVGTPPKELVAAPSALEVPTRAFSAISERFVQEQRDRLGPDDVLLQPELGDLGSSRFDRTVEAIDRGREAALAQIDLLAPLSVGPTEYAAWRARQRAGRLPEPVIVDHVELRGLDRVDPRIVLARIRTTAGEPLDLAILQADLSRVYEIGEFEKVDFRMIRRGGEHVLVIDTTEKSWGPGYLRFGMGLEADFDGRGEFILIGNYRRAMINRLGAEWRSVARVGSLDSLQSEFFQPLQYSGFWFVAPQVAVARTETKEYLPSGEQELVQNQFWAAELDLGVQFHNVAEIRFGVRGGQFEATAKTGEPFRVQPDVGGAVFRFRLDRQDNAWFPRSGTFLNLDLFASRAALGATDEYDRLDFNLSHSESFGPNTITGGALLGSSLGSDIPFYDEFRLGGFLKLSGLERGQLQGDAVALFSIIYYRRLANLGPLGDGFYVGGAVQAGNAWPDSSEAGFGSLIWSGTLFVGAETIVGPIYVGYGITDTGEGAAYLFLGRLF